VPTAVDQQASQLKPREVIDQNGHVLDDVRVGLGVVVILPRDQLGERFQAPQRPPAATGV